jgi:hypothetical protein
MDTEAICLRCEPGAEIFVVTKLTAPTVAQSYQDCRCTRTLRHHQLSVVKKGGTLALSQPRSKKIHHGLIERSMKCGTIDAGRVLANLCRGPG